MTVFDVDASEVVPTLELIEEVAVAVFDEEVFMELVFVITFIISPLMSTNRPSTFSRVFFTPCVLSLIFAMLASCFARPAEMESMQSSCTKTGIALRIIEKKSFYFKHQLHPGSENPA